MEDPAERAEAPSDVEPTGAGTADAAEPRAADGDAVALRRRVLPLVSAGLLVVVLVAGIVWFAVSTTRANRETALRDAATAYLTAVARSDAERALGLLAEPPGNRVLLTRPVLEASNRAAPLTDIQVGTPQGEGEAATVEVTYRLGDLPVTSRLDLTGGGQAGWRVVDGTADLTISELRALTVNGATLTEPVNPVFPGTYTAEPISGHVALAGEPRAVVPGPEQTGATIAVTPGLSEPGRQAVLAAVKGRFDECLASTDSRPANCPFGVSTEGVEVAPGSVRFALANDPWAGFAPTLDPQALTAHGTFSFQVNATATVTRDGLTTEATQPLNADRGYSVDLTREPPVVTWR